MSRSRIRNLVEMVKDAELEVVRHYSKDGRVCVDVRAPNGVERAFAISLRPGDVRGDLNEQSKIRRFARENTPIPPAVDIPAPVVTVKQKRSIVKPADQKAETPASTAAQQLTPIEFYRLCEWLKQANAASVSGLDVLARAASEAIGQQVSEAAMREAMEATDTAEPDAWNPLPDPHVVLAREIEALTKALGHEPSPMFRRLLEALA
ncbi:hypothetical protein BcepIL02_gp01 [Burkholderia phage BcepIL02]|uniref:Uncharacterized protein n=1 Tax=Burkholderia phage BcepIL02 TaxID=2886898 RepID=C5IHJ3_9CAUD|nr:hypothetical protein BcepIL02_gp01 [Burkholderia phage BcepIL02]ACR14994.1 hypothetical protein BcepIL02_gp01 [Burkholderia phage BcepIL02]